MAICNNAANSFIQINGAEPPLAGRNDDPIDPLDVFCGNILCHVGPGNADAANGCNVAMTVTGKQFVANKQF